MSDSAGLYADRVLIKIWALDAFDLAENVPGIAPSHPFDSVVEETQSGEHACNEDSDAEISDDETSERSYEALPTVSVAIRTSALEAAKTFLKSMGAETRVFQLQPIEN